eukprot:1570592-Pyramimonas_sp.AAC.1
MLRPMPLALCDIMNARASTGAGKPALLEAGCPAIGTVHTVSSTTRRKGDPSHLGLAAMVNAVAPPASVATPHSSTLIARCPDGVST